MTTLEMLHAIEEAKIIYEIAYRNAGVGFIFYEGQHDEVGAPSPLAGEAWRKDLTVESYHDSFEEAVAAEFARLPVALFREHE